MTQAFSRFDAAAYRASLDKSAHRVLMLDYDGTLSPFHKNRHEAVPYPGVREALNGILAAGRTELILISGRATQEVVTLLGLAAPVEVWGKHGWEHLTLDGELHQRPLSREAQGLLDAFRSGLVARGLEERIEDKGIGLAVHWRGLSEAGASHVRQQAEQLWSELADGARFEFHPFDGGLELRPLGQNKGSVVGAILAAGAPGTSYAYLGDDNTDEDAFRALRGHGLTVLVRGEPRATEAALWIRPPEELLTFLALWR